MAVMQPYFFPYAGYFRLFAAADLFVVYDCVQFPRRGFVHRNRLPDRSGRLDWLTLPLRKCRRDTVIENLAFPADARSELARRMCRFPGLDRLDLPEFEELRLALFAVEGRVVDYLDDLLGIAGGFLGMSTPRIRSSALGLPADLRGADRILEICRLTGARRYVNAPGGRGLYDHDEFRRRGVELRFLPAWNGPDDSMLHRLLTEPHNLLARDLTAM
ncbi:MAG: WbqC family protein [Thalassobaculum sp.]|uniref:WbqC family protein n=1 Tax=Thalassobaculum sp. TaxID=2022740 RepID=UPI0032EF8911